jgi:hypothetical protein
LAALMSGLASAQPTVAGEKRFVPYLSDSSLIEDASEREAVVRAAAAATEDAARGDYDDTDASEIEAAGTHQMSDDDAGLVEPRAKRAKGSAVASWTKAVILATAVVVIGAFAWYAAQRFAGPKHAEIKFAAVAWLIGMGTASAMVVRGRHGAAAKILSGLAAVLAIVLGKALILCYPQVAAELTATVEPAQLARAFARLALKPMDGVFAAVAIMGSTARFILAQRDA